MYICYVIVFCLDTCIYVFVCYCTETTLPSLISNCFWSGCYEGI